jgi:AdoMet-dependent rRNA methyltransferase SPB1
MQVAKQNMPVSSIVIGIDLFPIKPIPGCISLTEDITTDKCKSSLTKELKTWKVDLFLNDGAPNVGRNWIFDAYQQICLSLSAAKLATEFLRPGGWFVTKVFRSKDYNAFVWVLKQLFKKVYATKPSASRKESAEIFVVCQGYKAPTKIDPRFLDPKYVFEELDIEPKNPADLLKEPKGNKKPKAVGYDAIDLRKVFSATEFLQAESALEILQAATEIQIDDAKIENHKATTFEIRECLKDIKVLNRKDLKDLIKWWKLLKEEFYPDAKKDEQAEAGSEVKKPLTEEEQEDLELDEIDKHIEELKMEEHRDEKRKKKKSNKERAKIEQKLALKMIIKGDSGPQETRDEDVFNLNEIKTKNVLDKLMDGTDITKKREHKKKERAKMVLYDENELHDDEAHIPTLNSDIEDDSEDEIEEELGIASENEEEDEDEEKNGEAEDWDLHPKSKNDRQESAGRGGAFEKSKKNPLLTDLDYRDKDAKKNAKAQFWFEKDIFKNNAGKSSDDRDADFDLDTMVKNYKKQGIKILGEDDDAKSGKPDLSNMGKKARRRARHNNDEHTNENANVSSDDDSDNDDNNEVLQSDDEEYEKQPKQKKIKLSPEELAIGQVIATSKKNKRDLFDGAWNRYMFNDDNLPDWFVEDEKLAMRKGLPVSDDVVNSYRKNMAEFNTRSIKKVMEAKARKKRQAKKQMEKLKKKAEKIMENADNTGQEKIKMLKKLYKKTEKKKEDITYVVTKKNHSTGKKVRRPAGVKGRFKVVDPRMKKDLRAEKKSQKINAKKGGGKKSSKGGAKKGKAK